MTRRFDRLITRVDEIALMILPNNENGTMFPRIPILKRNGAYRSIADLRKGLVLNGMDYWAPAPHNGFILTDILPVFRFNKKHEENTQN